MRYKIRPIKFIFLVVVLASPGCIRSSADQQPRQSNLTVIAININTATTEELTAIPNIGEILAQRIIEFRERNGRFQRPEDLLLVPGISDKRFREIRNMVRTE